MTDGRAKKDIVVLGLGNPLMSDEGIGPAIIERFYKYAEDYPLIDFIDAGTGGISILHLIANRRKAIFIDCAYMGAKAGTIRKFGPTEVKSVKKLAHQSLHEIDILNVISLSKKLDQQPKNIVIFAIEPENTNPGQALSETLASGMNNYITAISQELAV